MSSHGPHPSHLFIRHEVSLSHRCRRLLLTLRQVSARTGRQLGHSRRVKFTRSTAPRRVCLFNRVGGLRQPPQSLLMILGPLVLIQRLLVDKVATRHKPHQSPCPISFSPSPSPALHTQKLSPARSVLVERLQQDTRRVFRKKIILNLIEILGATPQTILFVKLLASVMHTRSSIDTSHLSRGGDYEKVVGTLARAV